MGSGLSWLGMGPPLTQDISKWSTQENTEGPGHTKKTSQNSKCHQLWCGVNRYCCSNLALSLFSGLNSKIVKASWKRALDTSCWRSKSHHCQHCRYLQGGDFEPPATHSGLLWRISRKSKKCPSFLHFQLCFHETWVGLLWNQWYFVFWNFFWPIWLSGLYEELLRKVKLDLIQGAIHK